MIREGGISISITPWSFLKKKKRHSLKHKNYKRYNIIPAAQTQVHTFDKAAIYYNRFDTEWNYRSNSVLTPIWLGNVWRKIQRCCGRLIKNRSVSLFEALNVCSWSQSSCSFRDMQSAVDLKMLHTLTAGLVLEIALLNMIQPGWMENRAVTF